MSGEDRCHERNSFGGRCTIEGEHTEITNSSGQRALAHETTSSIWSTPISGLITRADPRVATTSLEQMIGVARGEKRN